jgi:hypothetical protein
MGFPLVPEAVQFLDIMLRQLTLARLRGFTSIFALKMDLRAAFTTRLRRTLPSRPAQPAILLRCSLKILSLSLSIVRD